MSAASDAAIIENHLQTLLKTYISLFCTKQYQEFIVKRVLVF
jgi:hypothetical protein